LPESRHQSRYHPSYTAPVVSASVRRDAQELDNNGEANIRSISRQRPVQFYMPYRRGRTPSPVGLTERGFQGLYGGRENGDEEQNWAQGVRFNNAEISLWGSRDDRNDGRNLRETPEPEDWRVGRRD
jgi:hypothetical protein